MIVLDNTFISICKETSKKLTGNDRRVYQAKIVKAYLQGNVRKAETMFGWGRGTVSLGIREVESGYICYVEKHVRGNKKIEDKLADLEENVRKLVEPHSQVDPKFQSPFSYTKITARAVHQALIDKNGYTEEQLPTIRTINNLLNRMGYKQRRVQKVKPKKK
jgi:hypothetical protein